MLSVHPVNTIRYCHRPLVAFPPQPGICQNDLPMMFGSKSTSCITIFMSSPATDGCLRTVSFCSVSWMTGCGCCCSGCCGCCCSCCPSPPLRLENEFRAPLDSTADRKLLMSGLWRTQNRSYYYLILSQHSQCVTQCTARQCCGRENPYTYSCEPRLRGLHSSSLFIPRFCVWSENTKM